MISAVLSWLQALSTSLPLPIFVIVGGLTEELVAPIPSPLVATLAGGLAVAQERTLFYIVMICLIGGVAKTLGAWIFFELSLHLKDALVPRFGKYIGVSEADLQRFGKHFNGSRTDLILLTFIRSIPVMPSTPISVLCGALDISRPAFFVTTTIGFIVRNAFFMTIGAVGLSTAGDLMAGIDHAETVLKTIIVLSVLGTLGFFYWKRSKRSV